MRKYLKELREKNRLTQLEISKKLDISESYYNQIEKGERQQELKMKTIVGLSSSLKISINSLIKLEENWLTEKSNQKGA